MDREEKIRTVARIVGEACEMHNGTECVEGSACASCSIATEPAKKIRDVFSANTTPEANGKTCDFEFIKYLGGQELWRCTGCNEVRPYSYFAKGNVHYCPQCGAKITKFKKEL